MSLPPQGAQNNVPLKRHLLHVWKSTGKKPKELADQPPLPKEVAHLWSWYCEVHNPSQVITYIELESWSRLTCKHLIAFEVEVLRKLNAAYWELVNGRSHTSNHSGKQ